MILSRRERTRRKKMILSRINDQEGEDDKRQRLSLDVVVEKDENMILMGKYFEREEKNVVK